MNSTRFAEAPGKVLVLGSNDRMVLPIFRSLGRKNIQVDIAWSLPDAWFERSRYLRASHPLPTPVEDDSPWLDALIELAKREKYDLVIPSTDLENVPCQLRRAELESHMPIYLLSREAFRVCADKVETVRLAEKLGVPCPKTVVLDDPSTVEADLGKISLPAVVKPCSSYTGRHLRTKRFVKRVYRPDELRDKVVSLLETGEPVVVQEMVSGNGAGIELLAHEGKVLYAFQHERLHESLGLGSTYRMSVPIRQELLHASAKMMEALRYTGVAMVEYRIDPPSGRFYLMEINGRFWGSLPLATAAGADFPFFLYEMLVRGKRVFSPGYRLGVRSRNLTLDALWYGRQVRASRDKSEQGWDVNRVSRWQLLADMARAATFRDHVDSFARDDWGPFLAETRVVAKMVLGSLFPKRSVRASGR